MPRTVNVDYVTKQVKILLHDSDTESLAAATAIAAAAEAQEAKDVVVDNLQDSLDAIDTKTESEKTELDTYTGTKKTEISAFASDQMQTYADSAAASAQAADTTAAALTAFLETKETLTAPAVDATLAVTGAAADSKVVGGKVSDLVNLTDGDISQTTYVSIPCTDGEVVSSAIQYRKFDRLLIFNGYSSSAGQRNSIYGEYAYTSTAPSYANHPDWYHGACTSFTIGHIYRFNYKLLSGTINRGSITNDFYFDMRTQGGNSILIAPGETWVCTFQPEMIAFCGRAFTYTNAVLYIDIVDITELSKNDNVDSETIIPSVLLNYETDGSYAYLALGDGSVSNRSIFLRSRVHKLVNAKDEKYTTNGMVATAPSGFTYCWKIPYGQSLIYNIDKDDVEYVADGYNTAGNSVLIAYITTGGNLYTNKSFAIEKRLAEMTDDIDYAVPSYFESQMVAAIAKINTDINSNKTVGTYGTDIESFVFITDVHWAANKKHSPALIRAVMNGTAVQTIVCGGDIIQSYNASKNGASGEIKGFIDAIKNIPCYEYFGVFGNHDDNSNSNSDISIQFTKEEQYNLMYPFASAKNIHWIWEDVPGVFSESSVKNDYYVDHPRTQTRYLCIDWSNPLSTARVDWIQSVLGENDGYRVIVIYHGIYSGSGGVLTPEHTQIMDAISAYKSKIVAVFSGHAHMDDVIDYYGDGSVPVILTSCDTFRAASMSTETTDEQCFDVVVVDYNQQKVKLTRIGRGLDREISISI